MKQNRVLLFAVLISIPLVLSHAAEFYVATTGDDANPGSQSQPFATVQRAQDAVAPGDIVLIRGGTCHMTEAQIARRKGIFAYITYLDKSGTPDKRINYWAYQGERPVFDCSTVKPALRVDAFYTRASWIHLKGLEVTGV